MYSFVLQVLVGFLSLALVADDRSTFTGMWEGRMNGLPGIDLTVKDVGGKISGVMVFYFQKRDDQGKWHVESKYTVPLIAPQADGKILTFEAAHGKFHGSSELGPNVKFRMELTRVNRAILRKIGEDSNLPAMKLIRRSDSVTEK
jgi:hypothetical protein